MEMFIACRMLFVDCDICSSWLILLFIEQLFVADSMQFNFMPVSYDNFA